MTAYHDAAAEIAAVCDRIAKAGHIMGYGCGREAGMAHSSQA